MTLLRNDLTERHPRLVVAGAVGLLLFLTLYSPAFLGGLRPQPLSRSEIGGRALAFVALEGWNGSSTASFARPIEGDEPLAIRDAGGDVVNREALPDPAWEVDVIPNPTGLLTALRTFTRPDPILALALTPDGEVVQYIEGSSPLTSTTPAAQGRTRLPPFHEIDSERIFEVLDEDRRPLTDEARERALAVARDFFARHAIPVEGGPKEIAAAAGPNDTEMVHMRWSRPGPAGTEEIVSLVVWQDRVAAFDRDLRAPGKPVDPPHGTPVMQIVQSLQVLIYFALAAFIAALLLIKRRLGEVDFRSAVTIFALYVGMSFVLVTLTSSVMMGILMTSVGTKGIWGSLAGNVFGIAFVCFLLGFLIAGAWAVGEGQAYLVWPRSLLRPFSAFMRGHVRAPGSPLQIASGYLLAFLALGTVTLVGLVSPPSEAPSTSPILALQQWPVWLSPGLSAFVMALSVPIISGFLVMSYVKTRFNRLWLVLVAGAVASLGIRVVSTTEQFFPSASIASVVVALGLAIALPVAFVRFGPLAQFVAVFVFISAMAYYPLLFTGNEGHAASGAIGLALVLVPAAFAAYGAWRPQLEGAGEMLPAHVRRALDRLRISEEFDVARDVQLRLLPKSAPQVNGFAVAGTCVPANEVGGDYYDYFRLANGNLGIAVGDVSGKGVGAAIYMTLTKSYMVTQAPRSDDLVGVLARVNDHLRQNLARGTFVTLAYAVLDVAARTFSYARAGHNPPLLVHANGEGDFLSAPGIALGAAGRRIFESTTHAESVGLHPGDLILLYTDGITEAMNTLGEEYGEERFVALARKLAMTPSTPASIVEAVLHDVRAFIGRAPQHDDITLVIIRVGEPSRTERADFASLDTK